MSTVEPPYLLSLPRELRDTIYSFLWSSDPILLHDPMHIITVAHNPSARAYISHKVYTRLHDPRWLLTCRTLFAEGLEEFKRGAVCVGVRSASRNSQGIDNKALYQRVTKLRIACAAQPDKSGQQIFIVSEGDWAWDRLLSAVPGATHLTLSIASQDVHLMPANAPLHVESMLAHRARHFTHISLELTPPEVRTDWHQSDEDNCVPDLAAISTGYMRLQEEVLSWTRQCLPPAHVRDAIHPETHSWILTLSPDSASSALRYQGLHAFRIKTQTNESTLFTSTPFSSSSYTSPATHEILSLSPSGCTSYQRATGAVEHHRNWGDALPWDGEVRGTGTEGVRGRNVLEWENRPPPLQSARELQERGFVHNSPMCCVGRRFGGGRRW
jgi:hypothetical protein